MWAVARWKVCGQEPGSWGGSGGAEPLLACDLDEKDEAGRAEGEDSVNSHPCILEARQTTPSTAVNTACRMVAQSPMSRSAGSKMKMKGTMKAAMPSLKAVKPVFMGVASAMAAPA